jgi:hypothetical protein
MIKDLKKEETETVRRSIGFSVLLISDGRSGEKGTKAKDQLKSWRNLTSILLNWYVLSGL